MRINWHELESLFIDALINMFDWPEKDKSTLEQDFPYDKVRLCIINNLIDQIYWKWNGEQIKLIPYLGCSLDFNGPIHEQSKKIIPEIEKKLTEIFIAWYQPYKKHLLEAIMPSINSLHAKGIPVERVDLPEDWKNLVGNTLLGFYVKKGNPCIFSAKQYQVFSTFSLG
jgi:hypothetical protein